MKKYVSQFTFTSDVKDPQFKNRIFNGVLLVVGFALFFGVAGYFVGQALYSFTH